MLPVSGSAYSYAYATLGEFVAWFIGWMLVLEYTFAAATVSVGWSGYLTGLLDSIGHGLGVSVSLPTALTSAPFTVADGRLVPTGSIVNLPAIAIATAIAALCYRGITQSAFVNSVIVVIKLIVIFLFMGFSLQFVDPDNWTPFIPESEGPERFGWGGVLRAASIVFFAYIGFDAVSTAAQEAKNPQRDMPIGILGSLAICTIIYIAMSAVMTGIMPYNLLGTPKPVATALETYPSLLWLKTLVEIGAIAGLSSVILVMMVGQPRIFYSMSRDGLIPPMFGRVHPKYRTPHVGTVVVGVTAVLLAGLLPIGTLGELVSMGTLLAFATVCIGIPVLRRTRPDGPGQLALDDGLDRDRARDLLRLQPHAQQAQQVAVFRRLSSARAGNVAGAAVSAGLRPRVGWNPVSASDGLPARTRARAGRRASSSCAAGC
jgi:APA family basic amino acid/polyamine antiporter